MKKFVIIVIVILVAVVSGCSLKTVQTVQTDLQNKTITGLQKQNSSLNNEAQSLKTQPEVTSSKIIDNLSTKTCSLAVEGFYFDYPGNWGDCRVSSDTIYFRSDYKKYQVDLSIGLIKTTKQRYDEARGTALNLLQLVDKDGKVYGEIYEYPQGGSVSGGMFKIGDDYYTYAVNIESNQPAPYSDGLWSPDDHNVTKDIILDILKTVRKQK